MELEYSVQNYDWGKIGQDSMVAALASSNGSDIKDDKPYAELWLGVHPSGPSRLKNEKVLLSNYINENVDKLGDNVVKLFGKELPFLFKVLSVQKALSIQAHPSKAHAEQLFKEQPNIYKDSNHKPELAIALTDFEALCGFKTITNIKNYFLKIPELNILMGPILTERFLTDDLDLKSCFEALMNCEPHVIKSCLKSIINIDCFSKEIQLIRRLNNQYPDDIGCLCVFFLNHVVLTPGEAIFLAPNEPHAYIFGDCIECMANSDNVVRAGLTPKLRDVSTLCNMLTYRSYEPESVKFHPEREDDYCLLFRPSVKDFAVAKISIPAKTNYNLISRNSASIILALSGKSKGASDYGNVEIHSGVALFLPASEKLAVETETEQILYQAICNV